MKFFLLSLMVLASLVSCGKESKSSNGVTSSSSNGISLTEATANDLGNLINSSETSFATVYPLYRYFNYKTLTSTRDCQVKEGWFGIDYTKCSTDQVSTIEKREISLIDVETKKQELRDIINSSSNGNIQVSGRAYYIRTYDGSLYVIDRAYPLKANPVSVQLVNGKFTYFAGAN